MTPHGKYLLNATPHSRYISIRLGIREGLALKRIAGYRALDAQKIIATIGELKDRIGQRFPNSGLSQVCADLEAIAQQTPSRIEIVSQPHWLLRAGLALTVLLCVAIMYLLVQQILQLKVSDQLSDTMQGLDAAMNLAVILGGGAFFVATIETRVKRRRALAALHELRSIIHVIDMHQLTKDPSMLGGARTSSSPDHDLTPFQLMRYLDYCAEMLSLSAKLAALYAERLVDPPTVDTVGDIERLTSNLSSKIWQKISMVQMLEGRDLPLPNVYKPKMIAAPAVGPSVAAIITAPKPDQNL
jgi:hypothetical protein